MPCGVCTVSVCVSQSHPALPPENRADALLVPHCLKGSSAGVSCITRASCPGLNFNIWNPSNNSFSPDKSRSQLQLNTRPWTVQMAELSERSAFKSSEQRGFGAPGRRFGDG
jgi:hypothetical protein